MDPKALVGRVRDLYVEQFVEFAERQLANGGRGAAEVKIRLGAGSTLFEQFYCVDFLQNDESPKAIELAPERVIQFDLLEGAFGASLLRIEHLRWEDVIVRHDLEHPLRGVELASWFQFWFDAEDERAQPAAQLSGNIHSLLEEPGQISIDFGTSQPDAFWDLLELLERLGAKRIEVSSTRAEAERRND
jgi:hypothetical protein